jgi:hypothetical protein
MPAVILGEKDLTENVAPERADENKTDGSTHTAAFMVLIDKDGNFVFEPDINKPVIPSRAIKPIEVKNALSSLLDEIRSQEIAITTINMQMQAARQMQEQQASHAILKEMGRVPR